MKLSAKETALRIERAVRLWRPAPADEKVFAVTDRIRRGIGSEDKVGL